MASAQPVAKPKAAGRGAAKAGPARELQTKLEVGGAGAERRVRAIDAGRARRSRSAAGSSRPRWRG